MQPGLTLAGVLVLVADDDNDVRDAVTLLLEYYGASVRAVATADEALEAIRAEIPDVLIADLAMPGGGGYALIRRVRALPAGRGGLVPAAALTAHIRPEDVAEVLSAGFQYHLPKPVDADRLVAVVAILSGKE
jgi:CheY-like chemotaxis protein